MTDFPICRSEDIFAQTLVAPVLFLECFCFEGKEKARFMDENSGFYREAVRSVVRAFKRCENVWSHVSFGLISNSA